MSTIKMVDLGLQYQNIKTEVDAAIQECINATTFINGPQVKKFQASLESYLGATKVIPCANGTDALQIAMMALGLKPGDEVIVPSFTYVATAEVIALLGLTPVMVDVDPDSFMITASIVEQAITPQTKAVVPVHLYGQCADMEAIMSVANKHNIYVIEDTAQAIGADYSFSDGTIKKAGTIGHIGCTSFFPSKNLGCYGDGGALYTMDADLGEEIRVIANHGQRRKYHHSVIGVNSRLDSIQAAILDVKLKYLDAYSAARRSVADHYDNAFKNIPELKTPVRSSNSTHVFHQYTMQIEEGKRDALKQFLADKGIPSMIYYPLPLNEQEAFKANSKIIGDLHTSIDLCKKVLSLPIHTEMDEVSMQTISSAVVEFFKTK